MCSAGLTGPPHTARVTALLKSLDPPSLVLGGFVNRKGAGAFQSLVCLGNQDKSDDILFGLEVGGHWEPSGGGKW